MTDTWRIYCLAERRTPERHDQNHVFQSSAHLGQATLCLEAVVVIEGGDLLCAEFGVDLVGGRDTGDIRVGVLDNFAILDVDAADGTQGTSVSAISSNELRDNSEGLGAVNDLGGSVEAGVAQTVRIEVASIWITDTGVAGAVGVGATAG